MTRFGKISPGGERRRFRTIWISDIHLGTKSCNAELLIDFLDHTDSETMYLVGDIIDGWRLKKRFYWPAGHNDIVWRILKRAKRGTRIVYIPGNHDEMFRQFTGLNFGGVEIRRAAFHDTADGRRLLVMHGDEFDAVVRGRSLGVLLGGFACRSLLKLNRFVHWLHDLADRPYWSLAQHVKSRFGAAQRYVGRYEKATLDAARAAGVDGVICGHIHKADLADVDGMLYCNDGDWVESCTALVEDEAGELSLLRWRPSVTTIAASATVAVSIWSGTQIPATSRSSVR